MGEGVKGKITVSGFRFPVSGFRVQVTGETSKSWSGDRGGILRQFSGHRLSICPVGVQVEGDGIEGGLGDGPLTPPSNGPPSEKPNAE